MIKKRLIQLLLLACVFAMLFDALGLPFVTKPGFWRGLWVAGLER